MRPYYLSSAAARLACLAAHRGRLILSAVPALRYTALEGRAGDGFLCVFLFYSLACVNMSKISDCGEYRGRTDDLLHAMQAL